MQNLSPEHLFNGLQRTLRSLREENNKFVCVAAPIRHLKQMSRASSGFAMISPAIFLLGVFCLFPACADIYTYTDNDGTVYLSNTPANKHYQVLISSAVEHEKSSELPAARKSSYGIFVNNDRKLQYDSMVEKVARTYGMDSALLHAVIAVESNYNPNAVSRKGASGLMQLMPGIAKHYGVVDLLDPVQNLQGGAQYLRDMLILFNNDVSLAVAAYNAGETAVVRYGNRIPPFQETMEYVPKVLNLYRENRADRPLRANNIDAMAHPGTPEVITLSNVDNATRVHNYL